MSFDPRNPERSAADDGFPLPQPSSDARASGGSQGASRGGHAPDPTPDDRPSASDDGQSRSGGSGGGFSGWPPRPGRSSRTGGSATFLGLPVALFYLIGASIIGLVFLGAVCGRPAANGSVAGQVKALSADRQVSTLAGAQVVLRGANDTYTTVSTDAPPDATGEAAYNYRFENVPPGSYTMAVTPPAGANLQPESDINFKVESGQLFPQSVMLLADGIQKPRPLTPSELEPGQVGYLNDRGERVVYQQGGGFDATDVLLLYLLWRQPPAFGYGAPPVIIGSPGGFSGSTGSSYRVDPPPTTSRSGQTVTQRPPSVPGQGATRPSASGSSSGPGPSYNPGGSSGSSSSGSSGATTTRPSSPSEGASSPSQGATRPSSSSSSPSYSGSRSAPSSSGGSRSSGSSGGGRR